MELAVIKSMFKVKDPHGRAGVDVVVVENTVNCNVLSRPHDRFLRDVAHSWKQTMRAQQINIFGKKQSECQKGKKTKQRPSVEQKSDFFIQQKFCWRFL